MKLAELQNGDKFVLAQFPNGSPYVKGNEVPGTMGEKFYVHSTVIGYIYMGNWDDEVIKVGNINDKNNQK